MIGGHDGDIMHGESFLHVAGQRVEQFENVIGGEQALAQSEEALDFAAAKLGALGFVAGALGEIAGNQSSEKKGEERNPVLRIGDGKSSDRRQKEKIKGRGGYNGHHYGIAQSPPGGD